MQRSTDLLFEITAVHKQQIGTISPALGDNARQLSIRELEEYFRRSERLRELERELELALQEEGRKAV
ncbi:MAG TPA: hypothetical protein VFI95_12540 [Terriglobales bacterium]|nr:hypothetical protein [Terriglobales bacterium]